LGYTWLYSPLENRIFDTVVQIDELTLSRQNAAAIRKEHERLSSRLEDIEARYAALQRRVPANADAGSFLKQVSEIADQEKLVISNFQPANSVEGNNYAAMEILLEGRGSFAGICSFFDRLAKLQRLSKVRSLSIVVDEFAEMYPIQTTIVIY
jgi:Tfp pilus assembly protein PilO